MESIRVEYRDKAAILKLNRGITNAVNLQLVDQLVASLQRVRDDSDVHSIVLGSSKATVFSSRHSAASPFTHRNEDLLYFDG